MSSFSWSLFCEQVNLEIHEYKNEVSKVSETSAYQTATDKPQKESGTCGQVSTQPIPPMVMLRIES